VKAAGAWKLGFVALGFSAAFLGYNWVVMKVGLRYSQPFTFAALRTFFGALSMFLLLAVLRRPMKPKALGVTVVFGLLYTTAPVGRATAPTLPSRDTLAPAAEDGAPRGRGGEHGSGWSWVRT